MKRILVNVFRTICGLLCLLFIVLWVRSHYVADLVIWSGRGGRYYELVTIPGQFRFTRVSNWVGTQPFVYERVDRRPPWWPILGQQLVARTWTPIGIGFDGGSRRINSPAFGPNAYAPIAVAYEITAVPYALPALVLAIPVLWPWLRHTRGRVLRQERASRGMCPTCGYDMRATPGRCPECGHSPA